jgi:hypothetical protein
MTQKDPQCSTPTGSLFPFLVYVELFTGRKLLTLQQVHNREDMQGIIMHRPQLCQAKILTFWGIGIVNCGNTVHICQLCI